MPRLPVPLKLVLCGASFRSAPRRAMRHKLALPPRPRANCVGSCLRDRVHVLACCHGRGALLPTAPAAFRCVRARRQRRQYDTPPPSQGWLLSPARYVSAIDAQAPPPLLLLSSTPGSAFASWLPPLVSSRETPAPFHVCIPPCCLSSRRTALTNASAFLAGPITQSDVCSLSHRCLSSSHRENYTARSRGCARAMTARIREHTIPRGGAHSP